MEDLRRYMDEKGETFDIVLFDLPGTLRSEGVVHTVSAMDYIFVPLKADNIVMQSSLQFAKVLEEELIAKGNCNLKGIRLFWNMVDRRGRKDLYDAWNRVIHRIGGCGCCPHTSRTPSATTGRRILSARVSSAPRCSRPIPVRRKAPAFLNWWRRYAPPSVWRNPTPTGSGC